MDGQNGLVVTRLMADFQESLDEALILAILSDYDLTNHTQVSEARQALEILSAPAHLEKATGFDPSGMGHDAESERCESGPSSESTSTSDTLSTFPSCVSNSHGDLDEPTPAAAAQVFEFDSEEDAMERLKLVFQDLKPLDIAFALQHSKGNAVAAIEELLTIQYLEVTGQRQKGIDAFFTEEESPINRRKKRKKQPASSIDQGGSLRSSSIAFQSAVTCKPPGFTMPTPSLSSTPTTSRSSSFSTGELGLSPRSPMQKQLVQVAQAQPVQPRIAATSSAIDWKENPWTPVQRRKTRGLSSSPNMFRPGGASSCKDAPEALGPLRRPATHAAGTPKPLMRQAAVVLNETHAARRRQVTALEAEHVVASTRTRNTIDLHGVFVNDGVRIALRATREWWAALESDPDYERLGRNRLARHQGGFSIITGRGMHSSGGTSKLRPAVLAALLQEGWVVHAHTGSFVVDGKR